ncbi:hypothetical protein [Pseudoalteromonas fuliginea]|uniref:hypothetical protein n=1 Tax=Pseudoalteromonas fuliginea TaxID=1872678 RepID=UPI00317DE7A2
MKSIKFSLVNPNDECDLIFIDNEKNKYHIFTDERGRNIQNIDKDFWDKFFFCKLIKVEYQGEQKRIVTRIISYK